MAGVRPLPWPEWASAKLAGCGSCSSRRCTRGRTTRTSASSSLNSSGRGRGGVVASGVALGRSPLQPAPEGPPAFLAVGSLTERKNPLRLARAFERLGEGTLTFVGDGPLRSQLEGRSGIGVTGLVPHEAIPARIGAAHVVCGPSLVEPFGQALLQAIASGRLVVATRIGGPPEFVTPAAGVLVDPESEDEIAEAAG